MFHVNILRIFLVDKNKKGMTIRCKNIIVIPYVLSVPKYLRLISLLEYLLLFPQYPYSYNLNKDYSPHSLFTQ